jgi:hypothetical protein
MSIPTWQEICQVGPTPYYKHLCDVWAKVKQDIRSIDSIAPEHIESVNLLLSGMDSCDETKHQEQVLSGRIAKQLQNLIPLFDKNIQVDPESLSCEH